MNICLIGGIYGEGGTASNYLRVTPETTLEHGLRRAGHRVTTLSHYASRDFGQFDVVHVHHLSYGATRLASDSSRAKFVFTPHDASEMSGLPLSAARSTALKFVLSRADRVVSLSAAEAAFLQRAYRVPAARSSAIPNGIDAERFPFRRTNAAGRGKPWQVLFVGQLIDLKGCDLLLRAMASLEMNVELRLAYQAGGLEAELKALARDLGIGAKAHFLGRQEPHQLAELYQTSDLLVLASRTEALPSVITEAMLSGLPFVATDVGGVREQAAGHGYLLAQRTSEELTVAIQHVLTNYGHYVSTGHSASNHARATYSIDAMVSRHEALYQSLTREKPRRQRLGCRPANIVVRALVRHFGRPPQGRATTSAPVPGRHGATAERP